MSKQNPQLGQFIQAVKQSGTLWALRSKDAEGDEGWVICDSNKYKDADVMPLWSTEAGAQAYCIGAWADYQPTAIPLDEFFKYWAEELNHGGVLLGIDWPQEETTDVVELPPEELSKQMVGDKSS